MASTTSTEQSGLFFLALAPVQRRPPASGPVVAVGAAKPSTSAAAATLTSSWCLTGPPRTNSSPTAGASPAATSWCDSLSSARQDDPAGVRSVRVAAQAPQRIDASAQGFVSRGDKERHPPPNCACGGGGHRPRAPGYKGGGRRHGADLNLAAAINAYTVADRATWAAFKNRQQLDLVLAGGQPCSIPTACSQNPAHGTPCPKEAAERFAQGFLFPGPDGQPVFSLTPAG